MKNTSLFSTIVLTLFALVSFLSTPNNAQDSRVKLVAGSPGASLDAADRLVVALPIVNTGSGAAQNVRVSAISFQAGALIEPEKLPIDLGAIRPDESATVFATFGKGDFKPGQTYLIKVEGTFGRDLRFAVERPVRLPPAAPGEGKVASSSSLPNSVKGKKYPPQPPSIRKEVNDRMDWTVPTGRYRQPEPQGKESSAERAPGGRQHHRVPNPPSINFLPTHLSASTTAV